MGNLQSAERNVISYHLIEFVDDLYLPVLFQKTTSLCSTSRNTHSSALVEEMIDSRLLLII